MAERKPLVIVSGRVQELPAGDTLPGAAKILQIVKTQDGTDKSTASTIPRDATIPQNTEGGAYSELDTAVTPLNASSTLMIDVDLRVDPSATATMIAALFKDAGADALAVGVHTISATNYPSSIHFRYFESAGSTSARTYKIRFGSNSGTMYINRLAGTADAFGAAYVSSLTVTEIAP